MQRVVWAFVASILMVTGAMAQDGARAYFLLPEDTNILSLTGNYVHTQFSGSTIDAGTVTASYKRTIDVGGNAGAILIGLPVGGVSGNFATMMGVVAQSSPISVGDLFVGAELGLIGSPSLSGMDYVQHQPGLRAGVAGKLFLPTGTYDSTRYANLGQNRWSFQASLPISYVLGDSFIDPALTTFEIVPSVHIFGDNTNPLGGGTLSQEPLWKLEGHVTRTFSPMVWAALDAYFESGGRLTQGGVEVVKSRQAASIGATVGLVLSQQLSLRLTYTEQVYSTLPGPAGRGVELTAAYRF